MNTETKSWLLSYPKLDWENTFKFFVSKRACATIECDENGFSYFVRGYNCEFQDQDYKQALKCYEMGAELLDSLCIFKLHEIYLGDSNFKVELDEKKSLCYLAYGCMLNQFETFGKYNFWTKFETLFKKDKENKPLIAELISTPPVEYFSWISSFLIKVFTFVIEKTGYEEILPEMRLLPHEKLKKTFFYFLNLCFDFLAYAYNGQHAHSELVDMLTLVMDLTTSDLLFDDLFNTFITHMKLARFLKEFGACFNRRMESNAFWIWTFAYQTSMKNHYFALLMPYEDILLDGTIELKVNTASWISNYIAYCHETGCGVPKDVDQAYELYEKDIMSMPRILFSRFRKIITLLKKGEKLSNVKELIYDVKDKTDERMKDHARMDCYLFYVHGKIAEKIEGDLEKAMDWYKQGVESDTFCCLKFHLLANETWRARCARRLEKLRLKLGYQVQIMRRKSED